MSALHILALAGIIGPAFIVGGVWAAGRVVLGLEGGRGR